MRMAIANATRQAVLIESGYRCAVPTCRGILAIDLHHLDRVSEGGGNEAANLIAICPNCHALHHRGTIPGEALYTYKSMLVALNNAFDKAAIDKLLFLSRNGTHIVSGDGALSFMGLAVAGYVNVRMLANNGNLLVTYRVEITEQGRLLVSAWSSGNHEKLEQVLAAPPVR